MKRLILIRHCNAEGQHKDSPLTYDGIHQARHLATFLQEAGFSIDRILSSPYLRAIESIKPYAEQQMTSIEIDDRLKERILSEEPIDDWLDVLEQSFDNQDFRLPGGESSNDARERVRQLLDELQQDEEHSDIAVVTHGNLLAILLSEFQVDIGFNHWKGFTNPDIFTVQKTGGEYVVERVWHQD
ncbi:histidine phosphatase family protein [Radiobacillus kanasensis]|uniref:histidine phosphatase family protein n=1 Tax=Radiobacillus kanasensis TaxID=2844358 RepID=UPI001E2C5369|nr:histidine phosphatase family protein [Radiobacillus kanasensis]UFU01232.1 histidine phosphatase family protein [Radiobacillus kanasensis]